MPRTYDDETDQGDTLTDDFDGIVDHSINPAEKAEMERVAYAGAAEDIGARDSGDGSESGGAAGGTTGKGLDGKGKGAAGTSSTTPSASGGDDKKDGGEDGEKKSLFNNKRDALLNGIKFNPSSLLKNKMALGIFAGGILSVGSLIALIIISIGIFKIPHFAEHIAAYQFARVTRDYARYSNRLTATKMAIEAADDQTHSQLKTKYGEATGKVKDTWAKLDRFRPQKVITNMNRDQSFKLVYTKTPLGRERLKGVTMGDRTLLVQSNTLKTKLIPGYKFVGDVKLVRDFTPGLQQAMGSNNVGPIIRGQIGRSIRQQLGISLIAWQIGKYQGKSTAEARAAITQESHEKIKAGSTAANPNVSKTLQDTATNADETQTAAVNDPDDVKAIVANPNELHPKSEAIIDAAANADGMGSVMGAISKAVSAINPIYAVATPLCLIYDGSLSNAGPSINEQSNQLVRSFYLVQSASSQIKDGKKASGEAVGAMDWKLGNIEKSNAELRAAGKPVNTSDYFSTQASPTGQVSITDVIFPEPIDSMADQAAKICPVFTNVWVGLGVGIGNLITIILSGGTSGVGQAAATAAATKVTTTVVQRVVTKVIATKTLATKLAKDTAKQAVIIAGGTLIAKMVVLSQMGAVHNPTATDVPFANDADNGGNLHAQQIERQALYGAPMPLASVAYNGVQDQQYLAAKTSSQSVFERYLAPDNADSLVTRMGSSISRGLDGSIVNSLYRLGSSIFNPLQSLTNTMSLVTAKVGAQDTVDTANYGNVQWGLTAEEQKLIDTNESYDVLENQLLLDRSGKEDEIAAKYSPCFDPSKQMGELLTEETGQKGDGNKYYIVRDASGNVSATEGFCAADNLGPGNGDYGDLVFRWRVAQSYNTMLAQLDEQQNPTETNPPASPGGSLGTADGFTFPLLTTQSAIKDQKPDAWCYNKQTSCHHDYPAADIFADPGTTVVAAVAGTIMTINNRPDCVADDGGSPKMQIKGDDGRYYFYTHFKGGSLLVSKDQHVDAGTPLGVVGEDACAEGTPAHLHLQAYTSPIYGNNQSMEIQPQLVKAFEALKP